MYTKLLELIAETIIIDESDVILIESLFESISCNKGEILEKENKVAQYLYFINTGFMRVFYNQNGDQITTHINCPSGFITSFNSFVTGTPAVDNIECVTGCEVLRITKKDFDTLCHKSQKWTDFARIIYEKSLVYNEQRTNEIIALSAEQRYLKILKDNPAMIQNVPLQYIASFIGIKPESLSRIRKQIIS